MLYVSIDMYVDVITQLCYQVIKGDLLSIELINNSYRELPLTQEPDKKPI